MMRNRMMALAMLAVAYAVGLHAVQAQQPPGITRADVGRNDLGVSGREVIQVRVGFDPGASFGRHSHPGAEVAYVLEGTLEYDLEGKRVTLKAGESLFIPAGAVHAARNTGTINAVELATYIVEKGKPLVALVE